MRALRHLLVVAALALAAMGQTPPAGLNRWGGYKSFGPGTVNQGTLDNHLEFPIFNRPAVGRAQLNLRLSYDSQFWAGGWEPGGGWGWKLAQTAGSVIESASFSTCGWYGDPDWPFPGDDEEGFVTTYNYTVYEPDGTIIYSNQLPEVVVVDLGGSDFGEGNDCPDSSGEAGSTTIPDGKGYSIVLDDAYNPVVYASNGDVVAGGEGAPGFTDRNGNRVYATTSGTTVTYTDGLGTTAVTQTGSGTTEDPVVYTYTGPGGSAPAVTEDFKSISVTTDFGCAGYSEWTGTAVVPKDLVYPDGSSYGFDYDGAGRLDSVTLPEGGTITYAYTLECADLGNSALTLTNNVDSGEWSWARTQVYGGVQTVQTSPVDDYGNHNDTVTSYASYTGAPTEIVSWSGTNGVGKKLKDVTIATTTSGGEVETQETTTGVYDAGGTNVLYASSLAGYDSFGNVTGVTSYDWSTSPSTPGTEVRVVANSYSNPEAYIDQLNSVTVTDGGGTQAAKTAYSYDAYGNPTTVEEYTGASAYLSKSATYNANGTVLTATDVNGGETSYTYDGSCNGAFPTTITDPMGLSTTVTWNCDGGVMLTQTDANTAETTYFYADSSHTWRPTWIEDAAGNKTWITHPTTAPYTTVERTMTFNGGSSTVDTLTTVDGLGRVILQQRKQGPSSSDYDTVYTTYDELDRPVTVTLPYSAAKGTTGGTVAATTTYDALSRPLTVIDGNTGEVSYAYDRNDVLQTVGPAPGSENTKQKQLEYDGLGRLSSVCEVTGGTGSGSCGQTDSQTGYWTKYTYSTQGQITGVSQNAQSGTPQSRSYGYDQLGRLTSETNPESGTTSYTFDTDTTCGTSHGDLVKKTDAMGTADVTCYGYDDDHRLTTMTYPSGTYASATPTKTFVYDAATVDSVAMANPKGRLVEAYTVLGGSRKTDEGFSYTALGQKAAVYQSSPNSGGWYVTSESYWANGAAETLSVPGMTPTISYGVDGEGRPETVSASGGGQNPVTGTTYTELGVTGVTLGSGDSDGYSYDPNTGRMTGYTFTVNSVTDTGALTWNPNGSLGELKITDSISGTSDSQDCTYSHDDLGRLASVNCGEDGWGQTFTYDAYGNLAKSGTQSFGAAYANNDNRISTDVDFTPSYDANGNLTSDPVAATNGANAYDADGHAITLEGIGVTYDALGRAVEAAETGGAIEFVYGAGGAKLAVMSGQTLQRAEIPLPGGGTAVYNSSGLAYYRHADHLGSSRLASTPSQTLYSSTAYAPYGEAYDEAGTEDRNYTGMSQDIDASTSGGQYDFLMREQNPVQGRWWTPDPSGMAAVDPTNPQSWNRYAYVGGTPMSATDPLGLRPDTPPAGPDFGTPCTVDGIDAWCGGDGGGGLDASGGDFSSCPEGGCPAEGYYDSPVNGQSYYLSNGVNGWEYTAPNGEEVDDPNLWEELGLPDFNTFYNGQLVSQLQTQWSLQPTGNGGGGAPNKTAIGPMLPPQPQAKLTPAGCLPIQLASNFFGNDGLTGVTLTVNVAAMAGKQAVGSALPGPGWVYTAVAIGYDALMVAKSVVSCIE